MDILTEQLIGIPLIEEWLLKLGFEFIVKQQIYSLLFNKEDEDYFQLKPSKDAFSPVIVIDCIFPHPYKPFKYVHQLQNFYFALTGEELTFKQ